MLSVHTLASAWVLWNRLTDATTITKKQNVLIMVLSLVNSFESDFAEHDLEIFIKSVAGRRPLCNDDQVSWRKASFIIDNNGKLERE